MVMGEITWLHLSDLHFQSGDEHNRRVVLQALWDDIRERTDRISQRLARIDFILFTGDIAYHGLTDEFNLPRINFFRPLLDNTGLDWGNLFVVPGNHDIRRDLVTPGAEAIAESLDTLDNISALFGCPQDRNLVFARLQDYFDFFRNSFRSLRVNEDAGYFYTARPDTASQHDVVVLGLNSAWLAYGEEEKEIGRIGGAWR